jgi:hypothetical protein
MTAQAENLIIALALAAMVLIPLAESACTLFGPTWPRSSFRPDPGGGNARRRHAARDDAALLVHGAAFCTAASDPGPHLRLLVWGGRKRFCVAGVQFVMSEREGGAMLAGLPYGGSRRAPSGIRGDRSRLVWHSAVLARPRRRSTGGRGDSRLGFLRCFSSMVLVRSSRCWLPRPWSAGLGTAARR